MTSTGKMLVMAGLAMCVTSASACTAEMEVSGSAAEFAEGELGPIEQESALIDGTLTLDRPEIGALYFNGGLCTATLISDRVIITARHCVGYTTCETDRCMNRYNATAVFRDRNGREYYYDVERFTSFYTEGRLDEGYAVNDINYLNTRRSDYWLSDDVAVALLDRPVDRRLATPANVLDSEPGRGSDLTVWGYGCTDRRGSSDARKRYRDFSVGRRSDNLCPGDSGGPVTTGRDGEVLFVNSAYTISRDSRDVFGDVTYFYGEVEAELASWGEQLGGTQPDTPADTPDPGQPPVQQGPSPIVAQTSQAIFVPDGSGTSRSVTLDADFVLSSIDVDVTISHARPLDLAFVLRAPDGSGVLYGDYGTDNSTSRSFRIDSFNGRSAQGTWTLEFYDVYGRYAGSVSSLRISFNP